MKRGICFFVTVALILISSLCIYASETKTFEVTAVKDTWLVMSQAWKGSPKDTALRVGSTTSSEDGKARALIRFDLTSVPKDIEVVSAKMLISGSVQPRAEDPVLTIQAYRLLVDWDIDTACWSMSTFGEVKTPWADGGASALGKDIAEKPTCEYTWKFGWIYREFDVTEDVKGFLSGDYPNYGWMLKLAEEKSNNQYYYFYSSECGASDKIPKLVIEYK